MNEELIVPSKESALEVYQKQNGLDPFLEKIRKEIDAFVPDVSTKKGRDAVASMAYKVSKSKTALDDVGKELVNDLKELPKKIDAERKRVREILDSWKEEVRKPLTDWEQEEANRIDKCKSGIENIRLMTADIDVINSITIKERISNLESIVTDATIFQEFEIEAVRTKESILNQLKQTLVKRDQYESEQAELAKLRSEAEAKAQKDREEKIVKEAEERAIKFAEDKAKAEKERVEQIAKQEKEASDRRELELKLQIERAEKEKLQAVEKEKKRIADEIINIENEKIAREKDRIHRSKINNDALSDLIKNGINEECAKSVIVVIAKKLIRNISINY